MPNGTGSEWWECTNDKCDQYEKPVTHPPYIPYLNDSDEEEG